MIVYWKKYLAAFDQRTQRERLVITLAVLFGLLLLVFDLALRPQWLRGRYAEQSLLQSEQNLIELQSQVATIERSLKDPDAVNKRALEDALKELAGLDVKFRQIESSLVPAQQMPGLLRTVLGRVSGVSLVSLNTLPPQSLIGRHSLPQGDMAPPASVAKMNVNLNTDRPSVDMVSPAMPLAEQSSPGGNIYKHGIELKVAGSYSALLAYLSELEKESGRLLWGRMELSVEAYPRSILTLKVYTLSLTKDWLAL